MKRKKYNVSKITKKRLIEMLIDPQWIRKHDLSILYNLPTSSFYENEAMHLLVTYLNGSGRLWASKNDFVEARSASFKDESGHILKNHLLYAQKFPTHMPELITQLGDLMKEEALDYKDTSLGALTRKVRARGRETCLEAPVFSALVAYLSEWMRRQVDGHIEMIATKYWDQPVIWEPWVFDRQGRSCNASSRLYDMLSERDVPINLNYVLSELKARRINDFEKRASSDE